MHRLATAALAAGLLLALTACGAADNPPSAPSDKGGTEAATSPTASAKTYTFQDCVALLEYDFTQGELQDEKAAIECAHLTSDDYQRAVGEVLTNHKDEILNPTSTP